jgi:MFS family permease
MRRATWAAEQEGTLTIGDVFARAWDLWRRDVGWLILAGLVVGFIMLVVLAIVGGIFAALMAGAGSAIGADALDNSTGSLTGLGAGIGIVGVLVYLVAMFLIQVLGMTFYGGLFEMVIEAYRQQRSAHFADLFSGFRKFGSYALYALVMFGISIGLGLLNVLPLIGALVAFVVSIWISIIWLYVLPLIADQGLTFMEAAGKSNQMVKSAGWWWTFGMVILLGVAAIVMVVLIVIVAVGLGRASETAGIVVGILLFLLFAVLFPPYSICYVSVLYVASGGDVAVAPGGGMGTLPPAPPAPPAYGAGSFGTPPAYSMPARPPASDDAWKEAADPLAAAPPPSPLAKPSATAVTDAGAATAVTEAAPAGEPEPPAPPAPPGGGA